MSMYDQADSMFQGGGNYAPSFKFANIGDAVQGEILSTAQQEQTDINDKTGQTKLYDKRGNVKQQLQVILQTDLRNWQGVSRVPTNGDPQNPQPLPPSEDDGRRAIYVKGWMIGAVGDAVAATNNGQRGAPRVGGKLGVRFSAERPATPNNIKLYEAHYQPPAAGGELFSQAAPQAAPQAPAQQQGAPQFQQPVTQPQQAWGQPTQQQAAPPAQAPAQQQATPTQADPWATSFGAQPNF